MNLLIEKPPGAFVVVPTEPTLEMLDAYDEARVLTSRAGDVDGSRHRAYWALLAAAPKFETPPLPALKELANIKQMLKEGVAGNRDVWVVQLDQTLTRIQTVAAVLRMIAQLSPVASQAGNGAQIALDILSRDLTP
jgi:hypothetical protein